jgi:transposase InsO family protein
MNLINGLTKLKREQDIVCSPCIHGKIVAGSHARITNVMTNAPGQLLHLYTVGPSRVQSFGGKWYVLVIFDDYYRYSWVYFMASKDEAFSHFKSLVHRLNVEHPGSSKKIRSDNGTEFKNSYFNHFCDDLAIEHQFSSPYVPQQNGVVERKNRTLVEMARTMLDEFSTPRKFWAEAISTTSYVSNRVFLRFKIGKTPYELRFGRKH